MYIHLQNAPSHVFYILFYMSIVRIQVDKISTTGENLKPVANLGTFVWGGSLIHSNLTAGVWWISVEINKNSRPFPLPKKLPEPVCALKPDWLIVSRKIKLNSSKHVLYFLILSHFHNVINFAFIVSKQIIIAHTVFILVFSNEMIFVQPPPHCLHLITAMNGLGQFRRE